VAGARASRRGESESGAETPATLTTRCGPRADGGRSGEGERRRGRREEEIRRDEEEPVNRREAAGVRHPRV